MRSVARIPLKIEVQSKIHNVESISDKNGARILFVELKSLASNYDGVETKEFKSVD